MMRASVGLIALVAVAVLASVAAPPRFTARLHAAQEDAAQEDAAQDDAAREDAARDDAARDNAARDNAAGASDSNSGVETTSVQEKQRWLRLRQIAEGYKANRAAFTFGKCRIRYASHEAETLEDALAGKWKEPQRKPFDTTICFRDDALVWKTSIGQQNFAKKGRFALEQNGNSAVVYSPRYFRFDDVRHPLDWVIDLGVAFPSLVSVISSAETSRFEGTRLTKEDRVVRDGKEFVLLKRRASSAGTELDADFYVDRNRGHLPVIAEFFRKGSAEPVARRVLVDIRREGQAWFPMRALLIEPLRSEEGKPRFEVREHHVLELDVTDPPGEKDMTIQFTKWATFRNQGDVNSERTLYAQVDADFVTASINDIEGLYRNLQEVSAERKRTVPAFAAVYAFGWLVSDTRRGRIRFNQFGGQTESGQLLYLAANDAVRHQLALDPQQTERLQETAETFETDLVEEVKSQGLTRPALEELFGLGPGQRAAELRRVDEKMRALEEKLCERHLGALRELLTDQQFGRLKEIRWQLGGSRSLGDEALAEPLGLTAAQRAQIKEVNARYDEQLFEYFSTDFTQTPDSDSPIYVVVMTEVQKLSHERDAKAMAVLSQPQREQLSRLVGQPIDRARLE